MRGFVTDPSAPEGIRLAGDLPEPEPAGDELLLDVRAYSINRGELALIAARPDGFLPGQDVAGVVLRATADGSGPAEGSRTVGIVDWHGWAERVAVPVNRAAALPDAVSFEQGASLPIAGLTALRALRVGGSLLARRVLVTGATGGVGQFSVQLARAAGAHVTAHVSGPEREAGARELGAHDVVWDLGDETLEPFDFVLDGLGGQPLRDAVHRLAPGGTVATYGALAGNAEISLMDFMSARNGRIVSVFHALPLETRGEDVATLASLVADGRLEPRLGLVDGWESTPAAIRALRDRTVRGKAVLRVGHAP